MQISQRVFLVTGSGNGIGREVALALLAKGARVAGADLSAEGLAETARLAGAGDRFSTHLLDVSDLAAVEGVVAAVIEAHGHLDGLVNVAGIIQPFVAVKDLDRRVIETVMAVNFWGVVNTTTTALPLLLARPEAAILNVSSMGAFVAVPGQTLYGASKAAVSQFTAGLQAELRDTGVQVCLVMPGGVATAIAENSGADTQVMDAADAPMQLTSPAEAARQIVEGIEKGSQRVLIGKDAKALDWLTRLMPTRANALVAKKLASLVE